MIIDYNWYKYVIMQKHDLICILATVLSNALVINYVPAAGFKKFPAFVYD